MTNTNTTTVRRSARLQQKEPDAHVSVDLLHELPTADAPAEPLPVDARREAPDCMVFGVVTCFILLSTGLVSFIMHADPLHVIASVAAELLVVVALVFYRAGWIRGFQRSK